ncbi:hypothetical protein ACX0GZ_04490 [Sphingomonas aestuarii]
MSQAVIDTETHISGRYRAGPERRPIALALTIGIQALVVVLLMWVAPTIPFVDKVGESLTSFDVSTPDAPPAAAPAAEEEAAPTPPTAEPAPITPPAPREQPPERIDTPPVTPPAALPWIELTREQMASADSAVRRPPAAPPAARAGPPAPTYGPVGNARGRSGDSERVEGSGPNGEPLYAASWYRRPYPDELRGFLSTAQGPGWGLIACRTVADFRVEDCIAVGESPQGSNIARAVLAAAWQFRVRPPQIGGRPQVGEWVRIRIDYDLRRE